MPKAFISYSWDSDEHKSWVRVLATRLREDGVETTLDQWHLVPGDQLPAFMERSVRESDYVLIICTPRYKERSDARTGGVGYEGDIMTGEAITSGNERKFIPILRLGTWLAAAPSWLAGKYHVDLTGEPYPDHQYKDLLTTIIGTRPQAPPIGRSVRTTSDAATTDKQKLVLVIDTGPIRITGIVIDQIGLPRGTSGPGSALYRIPFRLSNSPPHDWVQFFIQAWDHPPRFTTMHRPGIASVMGDKIILNGTTIEEVERYHRDTLILAIAVANERFQSHEAQRKAKAQRERQQIEARKKAIEDAAKRIKFE